MKKSEKELRDFLVSWRIKYGDECPNLYHNSWLEEITSMCLDCWADYKGFSEWSNTEKLAPLPPQCAGINNKYSAHQMLYWLKEFLETDTHTDAVKVIAIKETMGITPLSNATPYEEKPAAPANTCDLWFIRREDGTDSAINPVANEFVSMDKIDKPHPTTKGEK